MSARIHLTRIHLILCMIGLFSAIGCAQKQPGGNSAAAPSKLQNPSDEECKTFALALHKAFHDEDATAFDQLVDYDAIIERAIGDIDDAPVSKKGFIQGIKIDHNQKGIWYAINKLIKEGGNLRFLRIHEQDGQKRALFRMILASGSVNYNDYVLKKESNGKIYVVDIFSFLTGQMMSAAHRQTYLPLAAEESKSFLDKLSGTESNFIKHIQNILQMRSAALSGEYQKAWDIYNNLPVDLQKDKMNLHYAIMASQKIGSEEYQQVLALFKASHPNDPCLDMLLVDYYYLRQEYDEAAASALRIDKKLGGDAHMKTLCANCFLAQQKYADARKMAQQAVEIEDDFLPAYDALLFISVTEKNFDESVRLLDKMNEKFDNQYQNIEETPENAEFLASPQYREWKEKQEKK